MPGRIQLVTRNNAKAPLEGDILKVMLEITGEEKNRSGLDLVVVLDPGVCINHEEKLEELKTAVLFVIEKLSVVDRLSIVSYLYQAFRLCPLLQMTESAQTEFKNLINEMDIISCMEISDGLEIALKILKDR